MATEKSRRIETAQLQILNNMFIVDRDNLSPELRLNPIIQDDFRKLKPITSLSRTFKEYNKRYFTFDVVKLTLFYSEQAAYSKNGTYLALEELQLIKDSSHSATNYMGEHIQFGFTMYFTDRYVVLIAKTEQIYNKWMDCFECVRWRTTNESILQRNKTQYKFIKSPQLTAFQIFSPNALQQQKIIMENLAPLQNEKSLQQEIPPKIITKPKENVQDNEPLKTQIQIPQEQQQQEIKELEKVISNTKHEVPARRKMKLKQRIPITEPYQQTASVQLQKPTNNNDFTKLKEVLVIDADRLTAQQDKFLHQVFETQQSPIKTNKPSQIQKNDGYHVREIKGLIAPSLKENDDEDHYQQKRFSSMSFVADRQINNNVFTNLRAMEKQTIQKEVLVIDSDRLIAHQDEFLRQVFETEQSPIKTKKPSQIQKNDGYHVRGIKEQIAPSLKENDNEDHYRSRRFSMSIVADRQAHVFDNQAGRRYSKHTNVKQDLTVTQLRPQSRQRNIWGDDDDKVRQEIVIVSQSTIQIENQQTKNLNFASLPDNKDDIMQLSSSSQNIIEIENKKQFGFLNQKLAFIEDENQQTKNKNFAPPPNNTDDRMKLTSSSHNITENKKQFGFLNQKPTFIEDESQQTKNNNFVPPSNNIEDRMQLRSSSHNIIEVENKKQFGFLNQKSSSQTQQNLIKQVNNYDDWDDE